MESHWKRKDEKPLEQTVSHNVSEKLPESVSCYKLKNGTRMYFRHEYPHRLYSNSSKKIFLDFPRGQKVHFAGEKDNVLYFYTQKSEDGIMKKYNFYKASFSNTALTAVNFEACGTLITDKEVQFAMQQPYFLIFDNDVATIESFEEEQMILKSSNSAILSKMDSFKFCVWREFAIILTRSEEGKDTSVMPALFLSRQMDIMKIRYDLPSPTSVYGQNNSLLYILCGTTIMVCRETLKCIEVTIEHPDGQISGVRNRRIFLNAPGLLYSQDFESLQYRFLTSEWAEDILKEDEGFESNQDSYTLTDVSLLHSWESDFVEIDGSISDSELNKENKRLRQTLDQLTEERRDREEKINALILTHIQLSSNSGNRPFSSKFEKEYIVNDIIGSGDGGCVFEAENKFDEWKYAVKRIAVDTSEVAKALREVRAMAQLDHPGIVRYNSTWIEKPPEDWQNHADNEMMRTIQTSKRHLLSYKHNSLFMYIQMQLCNYSLTSWLSDNTTIESRKLPRMKSWFKQIVSAVEYIHGKKMIHRDLKPCNILFAEKDRLKICDLGIVVERRMEDGTEITVTRTASGTEVYMSPEQRSPNSRINAKTDIFTLGLILSELYIVMDYDKKVKIFDDFRRGKSTNIFDEERTAVFVGKLTMVEAKDRLTSSAMLDDIFLA